VLSNVFVAKNLRILLHIAQKGSTITSKKMVTSLKNVLLKILHRLGIRLDYNI